MNRNNYFYFIIKIAICPDQIWLPIERDWYEAVQIYRIIKHNGNL